jgi:hypothetical protein
VITALSWTVSGSINSNSPHESTQTGTGLTPGGFAVTGTPTLSALAGVTTTFTFSNVNVKKAPQGHLELVYPGTGGSASVTGSFQGTDLGFASHGQLLLGVGSSELKAMYNTSGIAKVLITGGNLVLE